MGNSLEHGELLPRSPVGGRGRGQLTSVNSWRSTKAHEGGGWRDGDVRGRRAAREMRSWTPLLLIRQHILVLVVIGSHRLLSQSLRATVVIMKRRPSQVYMESSASIPRGVHECSMKRHAASYSNNDSDFTVATDIDYFSMARRRYGHSSDRHYVR
jgi:hypothetical protein